MKVLTFLLSIYILALNLVPCEDIDTDCNKAETEISKDIDSSHQHIDNDLCSPFCSCQCCHIHAISFMANNFMVVKIDVFTEVFYHFKGLEKDFNSAILQPPQI
ncbi:DUF6660 family protein [Pseudofulvibacter geojedonensis]|uniref:DUF6660 family protein n=1 Tax=Pseudofulvibacter geojedonensis TaxID=1123758 RepID=A0ABW3I3Z0_9FLAO